MTASSGSDGEGRLQLLKVKEAAAMLGDHPKTVYRMAKDGALPWVNTAQSGKRAKIRFREDQLNKYIEERSRPVKRKPGRAL